jgi:hypothetical protein
MSQRNEGWMQPGLDGVTHWLIRRAAGRAPEDLGARLEEEWLADSEAHAAALSRLSFAVGCCWAALVIANDCARSGVPAFSPVVAARSASMAAETVRGYITVGDRNVGYFSLRSGTLFLIVGLHAALFCGLITTIPHSGRSLAGHENPQQYVQEQAGAGAYK